MHGESRGVRGRGVHPSVEAVVRAFLASADRWCPGLVEGLYLTGSVALGDFRPGRSDIDFVAVTARRLSAADVAALKQAHAETRARHSRPYFDGVHVTWQDLAADAAACPAVPYTLLGRFRTDDAFEVNPVTWAVLARQAVAVRGPVPGGFEVGVDPAALRDWTLANLGGYWRRWHLAHRKPLSPAGLAALGGRAPAWGVLGVSRLHHTVNTGQIISKGAAGRYALETFAPRWHPVIGEALRLHRSTTVPPPTPVRPLRNPFARRRAATGFVAMVVEDATAER
ncbi:aminoglycoside adenylyltransferase domain-containing protein [Streptomyces sp. NPDC052496]|uniref:aminoglycoside adenylyltransferase domain-containing protein n=1 Tax=Streptomyces sp. NPDC052496 TaxID=3154951 RepID=UPI00343D88C1